MFSSQTFLRKKHRKTWNSDLSTQWNFFLLNRKTMIRNHLPIFYSNQQMLNIFRKFHKCHIKKDQNLREILSPSLIPKTAKQNKCSIRECNRKCDICKNFLVASPDFTRFATKRKYKIKGILKWDSRHFIYLIFCKCCGKQYVGSATDFTQRFKIHKSDINTCKIRCGVRNHLLNVSRSSPSKFEYLQVQLRETVCVQNDDNIGKAFWEREKYWQAQSFASSRGLNNPNE